MRLRHSIFFLVPLLCLLGSNAPAQQPKPKAASAEDVEFFEKRVRPLLAEQCAPCHSGADAAGKLRLDTPANLFGGANGNTLVTPGSPDKSVLIHAVRYTTPALRMPPGGKLPAAQIALLEEWVKRGAPLPPDALPKAKPQTSGFSLRERRKRFSYRPVVRPAVPTVKSRAWPRNAVDAFLLARLEKAGLKPAPPADRRTLIRRVTFDLTGLPPTPGEIQAFLRDKRPDAYERLVERLLASPHYGERWGRHWLDLVRYGETMGHEFDFPLPNAYQYRDYVIRAFNGDVPYDRFVKEHIAGDLLATPRFDSKTGRNESVIGTGFWWLGEGKHSPVDVKQEQADRIDNQIDVFGKAFLGQTIACARCHDHKFDPIPTKDYYALYGILKSSRYEQAQINNPQDWAEPLRRADAVHAALPRPALAAAWQADLKNVGDEKLVEAVKRSGGGSLSSNEGQLPSFAKWKPSGKAFARLGKPGDLVLAPNAEQPVRGLLARPTAHSGLRLARLEGALRSPSFTLDKDFLHLRLSGQKGRVHIIVENFLLIRDPIYGPLSWTVDSADPRWKTVDVRLWKGQRAYIELSDSPLANLTLPDVAPPDKPFDGWLRLDAALRSDAPKPPATSSALSGKPAAEVRAALAETLERWGQNALAANDSEALDALDALLRRGALPSGDLGDAARGLANAQNLLPLPVRAAAMCEGDGEDETVFVRGSHKTPGEIAPRLRLAAVFREDAPKATPAGSGRRELAAWVASPKHPLTARVMVNRVWKQHFGAGLVRTPDDWGHMGETPTHPELLDFLADEFVRQKWSLKSLHRTLLLSQAYRMSSVGENSEAAARKDPQNALLHKMPVRRLEAEAIRDSVLAVSGRLDKTLYGPSVPTHLTPFSSGRGRPASGPLDGNGRRTLYMDVRRNFPSPFLLAFDFPTPFTTIGRRTVSNVPAQALALMNGSFVQEQAQVWAERLLKETPHASAEARIALLYETAFGRPPTAEEQKEAQAFLEGRENDKAAWADLCHVLLNVKEFIFVR